MNVSKKWMIGFMLIVLSAGMIFANGTVEDCNDYYGQNGQQGMNGKQGMMGNMDNMETQVVEGKFSLVDGRYPSVTTNAGETYYLLIHFPMAENQIPAEGADLKLEAFQSPMAPNQLIVLSGEADGVVFEGMNSRDMDYSNGYYGNGRHGHGGYGRQGMMGNNGMNGNQQGWGTPAPQTDQ